MARDTETARLDAESDRALRHTWRRGFQSPEAAEALETLAALTLAGVRNTFRWDFEAEEELAAVASDLDSLADYLAWKMAMLGETEPSAREEELGRRAKTWETRLRALVREIRAAVSGAEEVLAPAAEDEPLAPDAPLEAVRSRVLVALALAEQAAALVASCPPPSAAFAARDKERFRWLSAAEALAGWLKGFGDHDSPEAPGEDSALAAAHTILSWSPQQVDAWLRIAIEAGEEGP
jgi:hypothetical protein